MTRIFVAALVYVALAAVSTGAQTAQGTPASAAAQKAREYRRANEHKIIRELTELLAIPNVATDTANIQRNAERLKQMLESRGVKVQLLPIAGRGPVVYGELATPGANRTLLLYCHYDGQPTDASKWIDTKPWEPVLRTDRHDRPGAKIIPFPPDGTPYQDDWRIYARSASDDKSPIVAILAAMDALRAAKIPLGVNVKFLLDGEEEAGSPNLKSVLNAHRDLFKADLMISADGPVDQSGRPQIAFGNRGVVDLHITVYGPRRPLHSGHYGNWTPNPAMRLAQLLATLKDKDGRVLVAGFYDDVEPLSPRERRALDEMPRNDDAVMRELGFVIPDGNGKRLVELINEPSLNIRGIRSAYVGDESQNVIPTEAHASIDMRLVRNVQPEKQVERVIAHIRKQGFHVVDREPTAEERAKFPRIAKVTSDGGYPANRTSMDLPASQALIRAVESAAGPAVKMPTMGGSLPMYMFERIGLTEIGLPIVNHDNNQHSENENLRLGSFWRGIEIFAAVLAEMKW